MLSQRFMKYCMTKSNKLTIYGVSSNSDISENK